MARDHCLARAAMVQRSKMSDDVDDEMQWYGGGRNIIDEMHRNSLTRFQPAEPGKYAKISGSSLCCDSVHRVALCGSEPLALDTYFIRGMRYANLADLMQHLTM